VTITPAVVVLTVLAMAMQATAAFGAAPNFGTPVRLPTFKSCGGYEPGIAIDKYGNIFVTAHKQNHCDAVADDPSAPTGVRAQSWIWTSKNGGANWKDMPGLMNLAADPSSLDVGDEGDIALDDATHPHLYFVDTKVADSSFTRWTIHGLGNEDMSQDVHSPAIPTAETVDDRPWVVAHGTSTVLYAANQGDKDTSNAGNTAKRVHGNRDSAAAAGPEAKPSRRPVQHLHVL